MLTIHYGYDKNDKNYIGGARSTYGTRRDVSRFSVGNPAGKSPFDIPRCRWEGNIKMDLQDVGCGCTEWIDLAQDKERWRAFVNAVMNLRVP